MADVEKLIFIFPCRLRNILGTNKGECDKKEREREREVFSNLFVISLDYRIKARTKKK